MPQYNEKEFHFKTPVEAEETCKGCRQHHGIRIFVHFEREYQLLGAPQRPREIEGTQGNPRESNKGQCRLIEE